MSRRRISWAIRRCDTPKRHHIPVVASFHTRFDTYFRYYGLKSLEGACRRYLQHFYAHCEHVYVPSPSMKEVLASARIGRDVRLWSRGIDRTMFTPDRRDLGWRRSIGIGDDEIVLLFVGRLVKEKAIGVVAELHDALKAPRCASSGDDRRRRPGAAAIRGPDAGRYLHRLLQRPGSRPRLCVIRYLLQSEPDRDLRQRHAGSHGRRAAHRLPTRDRQQQFSRWTAHRATSSNPAISAKPPTGSKR